MIMSRRTPLILLAPIAAALVGLVGCSKAADKSGSLRPAQASGVTPITPTATERALASSQQAPPMPDPSRTDPEAVAMRQRNFDWRLAQKKVAADAALKQLNAVNGADKPESKGN